MIWFDFFLTGSLWNNKKQVQKQSNYIKYRSNKIVWKLNSIYFILPVIGIWLVYLFMKYVAIIGMIQELHSFKIKFMTARTMGIFTLVFDFKRLHVEVASSKKKILFECGNNPSWTAASFVLGSLAKLSRRYQLLLSW